MWLTAEYADEHAAALAVTGLKGAGLREIELFSARPVELPAGVLDRRSHMSLIAVAAAVVNGGLATAFMYFAQHNYPLVTGGMPIVSPWATGVITYELTMAGAMAGVVIAFLWESGLLRRRGPAAPELKDSSVFVRVACPAESAARARECLAGAVRTEEAA